MREERGADLLLLHAATDVQEVCRLAAVQLVEVVTTSTSTRTTTSTSTSTIPATWMMSMVAMARPAPFTRHPMFPGHGEGDGDEGDGGEGDGAGDE